MMVKDLNMTRCLILTKQGAILSAALPGLQEKVPLKLFLTDAMKTKNI